ncbi:MAG: 16S rRNA (adenine(1518)-N(6)/adenine(1519)-N(6))-dimethyltransferase RsmA [Phycisphaerae bacterium]|jgi:16S rRNA (adenine1518-N6/adenine1519-N6)-dimethyltransferase
MAGQTLSDIRALLGGAGLSPLHRFGQNFLIDLNLMRKLVDAAGLQPGDVVLEVGCGTGSLTEMLLDAGTHVVGVEIDHGLQGILRDRLGGHPAFSLIQGDALAGKHEINPLVLNVLEQTLARHGATRCRLVANLPYQIATPLLMELLYTPLPFDLLVCTIQKEVADRLAAAAGTDAYGPVSVITETLAAVEPVAIIPPTAFWPRPAVESVALCLRPRPRADTGVEDVPDFVRFVRESFVHRRKMLKAAARHWDVPEPAVVFGRAGVNPEVRPDALSPAQWRSLHTAVRSTRLP